MRMGVGLVWRLEPDEVTALLDGAEVPQSRRVGFDRWEPFEAAVTMATGRRAGAIPASAGLGWGRFAFVAPEHIEPVRPRQVIVAQYPVPQLSPLLWDAAGLVTAGGSPAAHLFESARALGIPAVCGVDFDDLLGMPPAEATGQVAIAVNGTEGSVGTVPW